MERKRLSILTNGLYNYEEHSPLSFLKETLGEGKDTTTHVAIPRNLKDSELSNIFKPSCKVQLNLRRLRLKSILNTTQLYHQAGYLTNLDYTTVSNILIWHTIHGDSMFDLLKNWGLFNSQKEFEEKSKLLGSRVKVYPKNFSLKMALSELNDLAGHKLVDPQFNLREECESLANGGNKKQNYRNKLFMKGLNDIMGPESITPQHTMSFKEYVTGGHWLTTGSSSIGRVDWEHDKTKGHFKARKNMLMDIYSPEELWAMVSAWDGTINNKPIIKNELGKMRLAIASNLESYLHESYFMSLIGHVYTKWKYVTLDEKETAYLRRTEQLAHSLRKGGYALPWDFKSFDHQATTMEIQDILRAIASRLPMSDEIRCVVEKVILSYDHAYLTCEGQRIHVTGGLQSGQRITSLIGNTWNAAITSSVVHLARLFVPNIDIMAIGVRGDDTYIVLRTAVQAYYMRICYSALYAVGNDAKFSIRQHSCEFLRSEVSSSKVTAWPNRAIPAVTQRKPWSDNPWDPVREVNILVDNLRNVERRCSKSLDVIHLAIKQQWSKFTKQSYHYLHLPVRFGGLGLYPYAGWMANKCLPKPQRGSVKITTPLNGVAPEYARTFITDKDYSTHSLKSKITAGDVSKASIGLLSQYIDKVRQQDTVWTRYLWEQKSPNNLKNLTLRNIPKPPEWKFPKPHNQTNLESNTAGFPRFDEFLSVYSVIKTQVKDSLKKLCLTYYPAVARSMVNLESQGFHRTDAITIILGGFPSECNFYTNPRLSTIITNTMRSYGIYCRGREKIAKRIYDYTNTVTRLLESSFITRFYSF